MTLEIAKVVVVYNPTRRLLKILKRTYIGTIEETYDSGFLATSWSTAWKVVVVGAIYVAMATLAATSDVDPV